MVDRPPLGCQKAFEPGGLRVRNPLAAFVMVTVMAAAAIVPANSAGPAVSPGDIVVNGVAQTVLPARETINLIARSIVMPPARAYTLTPPRRKQITIDRATRIHPSGSETRGVAFSDLPAGVDISAEGPNYGVGKPLPATTITVWLPGAHNGPVTSVVFASKGQTIETACEDGRVRFWNAASGKLEDAITQRAVSLDPAARFVVTAAPDGTLRILTLGRAQTRATLVGVAGPVYAAAFSPDGQRLAAGGRDANVEIWSVSTRQPLASFRLPAAVTALAFTADGRTIAAGCQNGTVELFHIGTGETGPAAVWTTGRTDALAFVAGGNQLAVAGAPDTNHAVRLWDIRTGRAGQTALIPRDPILSLASANNALALGSANGTVGIYDIRTRRITRYLPGLRTFPVAPPAPAAPAKPAPAPMPAKPAPGH
ncbi:MAG TPA: WD40 repeat domain-containing protein [Armatimonadota bacterium]|nr:WD40 repeat domain-containing protein [Armatimonadota bacterium]